MRGMDRIPQYLNLQIWDSDVILAAYYNEDVQDASTCVRIGVFLNVMYF